MALDIKTAGAQPIDQFCFTDVEREFNGQPSIGTEPSGWIVIAWLPRPLIARRNFAGCLGRAITLECLNNVGRDFLDKAGIVTPIVRPASFFLIGAEIEGLYLLGTFENLYTYRGEPGHELVWLYEASLKDPALYKKDQLIADEGGNAFPVEWVPLAFFQRGEAPLYPDGLLELLLHAS